MKNLVLSSFILLVISSCAPSAFRNLDQINVSEAGKNIYQPWFRGTFDHILYHTSIDAFNNHFTGLIIIKPLPAEDFRIIFINELGIKIFDIELYQNGDYKVYYCLEYLNKKLIINTLKSDLSMMLNNQQSRMLKEMQNKESAIRVYKNRDKDGIKYIIVDENTARMKKIVRRGGLRKSATTSFYSNDGVELDSVRISHKHIKLDIHLSTIDENK